MKAIDTKDPKDWAFADAEAERLMKEEKLRIPVKIAMLPVMIGTPRSGATMSTSFVNL